MPFWQPFPTNVLQDHISPSLPWLITRPNANYAKNHIFYNSQDSLHIKLHSHNFSKVQISNLSLVLFFAKSEILHVKAQDKRCIKALTGSEFLKMRSNKINCFLETLSTDEYLKNPVFFLTQELRIKFWVLLNNTVDNTFFCAFAHTERVLCYFAHSYCLKTLTRPFFDLLTVNITCNIVSSMWIKIMVDWPVDHM